MLLKAAPAAASMSGSRPLRVRSVRRASGAAGGAERSLEPDERSSLTREELSLSLPVRPAADRRKLPAPGRAVSTTREKAVDRVPEESAEQAAAGRVAVAADAGTRARAFEPTDPIYPRLQTCGLLADTMALLLAEVSAGTPLAEISRRVSEGSFLSLRSASGRKYVLAALRVRYLNAAPPLPSYKALSSFLEKVSSPLARNQVLLPYLLRGDTATYRVLTRLVFPLMHSGNAVPTSEVVRELGHLFVEERRKPWSPYLQRRWAQGAVSVLRDVGALTSDGGRESLSDYVVRPEVFSFHLWGLWAFGRRGRDVFDPAFWKLLLLDEAGAREGVRQVAERRWWKISSVGGIDEVHPTFPSLEEWIAHGLG